MNNDKLHTPIFVKKGRRRVMMKQFLLSLLATTVSIALTFGTAAVIDHHKKQSEKREIVMMVMYDMYRSLQSAETADSMLRQSMQYQLKIAADTSLYKTMRYQIIHLVPKLDYTETAERIFSTSIETINTVGNVLFTENVAEFYQSRKLYKTAICDSIANRISLEMPFRTLKGTLNFDYRWDALLSGEILLDMRQLFVQCKQMMNISDEELEAYRKEREQMDKGLSDDEETMNSIWNEVNRLQEEIGAAREKLNLE